MWSCWPCSVVNVTIAHWAALLRSVVLDSAADNSLFAGDPLLCRRSQTWTLMPTCGDCAGPFLATFCGDEGRAQM
jgi:hypothetical protein